MGLFKPRHPFEGRVVCSPEDCIKRCPGMNKEALLRQHVRVADSVLQRGDTPAMLTAAELVMWGGVRSSGSEWWWWWWWW
jgi:hypothetical protein